jgi:sugar lactone lactonase YvrE
MRPGRALTCTLLCLPLVLTGCSLQQTASSKPEPAVKLSGRVHGGQQPIVGAHVYLFAANTTGYGQPSVSLLNAASTGTADSLGSYVLTDTNGAFTITGDYSCTPNTQVYLYSLGGNPGAGVNSAAGLLAALGNCPSSGSFLASSPFIQVNEITTIAAAYAMAGFVTDATHVSSSGTPLAQTGIANAFANAANLADISTGNALAITPAGNGTVPQQTINTLADILASCINSAGPGSSACSTLFSNSQSGGTTGTQPTDTATAAINIAHNPGGGGNGSPLFGLVTPDAPFQPTPGGAPSDFTIALIFTGTTINTSGAIAIDGSGNVWTRSTTKSGSQSVTEVSELSPQGSVLSGVTGYVVGTDASGSLAIDQSGNAWLTGTNHIYKVSSSGTVSTFQPNEGSSYQSIAIDGSGNVWSNSTSGTPSLIELSPSGIDLHFTSTAPIGNAGLAIDSSGIIWTTGPASLFATSIATGTNLNVTASAEQFYNVAIDAAGDPWLADSEPGDNVLTQYAFNSSTNSYSPISAIQDDLRPSGLAIDGSGLAWLIYDYAGGGVLAFSNSGSGIKPAAGPYHAGIFFYDGIALDPSGNIWLTNSGVAGVIEIIGTAAPVVTPISAGVKNHTLGTRP